MPFTKIDIVKAKVIFFTIFIIVGTLLLHAQPTPRGQPDVSNKTLITNANQDHVMGAAALHKLANDYYNWRNQSDPVSITTTGGTRATRSQAATPASTPGMISWPIFHRQK